MIFQKLLAGEKKLLKNTQVLWVENVPNWQEFSSKELWKKARINPSLAVYFPDFSSSRLPQRKYLLNVANTVSPNSVVNAVLESRKRRQESGKED